MDWKPDPSTWSLSDVFAHLNSYAGYYHPVFLKQIESTRFRKPKINYSSSPLGRSAWLSMKLGKQNNIKRKFNAPKAYDPSQKTELVTGNEVEEFTDKQQELLGIVEKAISVNLRRVKVPISISKMIRLRLGDAFLFVVYHNQRHVQQALNLTKHPKFPKK